MAIFEAQPLLCRKGVVSMSESTKLDVASDSASTASLKETNEERIVRDEGEMADAGDLEAARERSIDEKENEDDSEVDPYLEIGRAHV